MAQTDEITRLDRWLDWPLATKYPRFFRKLTSFRRNLVIPLAMIGMLCGILVLSSSLPHGWEDEVVNSELNRLGEDALGHRVSALEHEARFITEDYGMLLFVTGIGLFACAICCLVTMREVFRLRAQTDRQ
jgi:hypothetical protein